MSFKKTVLSIIIAFTPFFLTSQIPKEVPHPDNNSPIDITNPADVILYIVMPLLAVIFVLLWLRRKKKSK